MKFKGTRGEKELVNFTEAVLTGMAPNGGLWVPENISVIDKSKQKLWKELKYTDLCFEIMKIFITPEEIPPQDLFKIINKSVVRFEAPEVVEIIGYEQSEFLLNLFHGPTFAFKDIALQFLGNLFEYFIGKKIVEKINFIGATSGDTGSAAISGIKGKEGMNCLILYPEGRTSFIQELQMTTQTDKNIHCISIKGTYDDCQSIVKDILNSPVKSELSLAAVNSINFARILAQMIYFWYTSLKICDNLSEEASKVDFIVPTGNFGNILSAYYAKKMGAPIRNLVIASNSNDILTRFHSTGQYKSASVIPTISPAMDIQISSNFERFLFEIFECDSLTTHEKFQHLNKTGEFNIEPNHLQSVHGEFFAFSADEEETKQAIQDFYLIYNKIIDPHTAVGYSCLKKYQKMNQVYNCKTVIASTAHFGKFIDSVEKLIIDTDWESIIPPQLQKKNLMKLPKKNSLFDPQAHLIIDYLQKHTL